MEMVISLETHVLFLCGHGAHLYETYVYLQINVIFLVTNIKMNEK